MTMQIDAPLYSSEQFWTKLFRIIMFSYDIFYFKYQGHNYANCTNQWSGSDFDKLKNKGIKLIHLDKECMSESNHCCLQKLPNVIKPDEIEYIFEGIFNYEAEERGCEGNDENVDNFLDNISGMMKDVHFSMDKKITIRNISGFNEDHRGSDHTIIRLPFVEEVKLNNEFTLEDLVISFTNLRSHKFDGWYELLCDAGVIIEDDNIIIELNFDHGS
jgi:hypothetical protein